MPPNNISAEQKQLVTYITNGEVEGLRHLLKRLDEQQRNVWLNTDIYCGARPLAFAALLGQIDIALMLIDDYHVDCNQQSSFNPDHISDDSESDSEAQAVREFYINQNPMTPLDWAQMGYTFGNSDKKTFQTIRYQLESRGGLYQVKEHPHRPTTDSSRQSFSFLNDSQLWLDGFSGSFNTKDVPPSPSSMTSYLFNTAESCPPDEQKENPNNSSTPRRNSCSW